MGKLKHETRTMEDKVRKQGSENDELPATGSHADIRRYFDDGTRQKKKKIEHQSKPDEVKTKKVTTLIIDKSKPNKIYDQSSSYDIGDRIKHSEFGKGIVVACIDNYKMEVRFRHSSKILIMNQKAA